MCKCVNALFICTTLCNTLVVRHTNRRVWVQISHDRSATDCLRKGKHLCEWATTSLLEAWEAAKRFGKVMFPVRELRLL